MHVIRATQQMLETRTLVLGFQGENLRTQLRIDCAATFAEYPNATPALAIKPPSGETYPVFVERDGNEVVWNIVANNLLLKGDGELQLTFYKDNVIAKTYVGHITVNRSLQIDGEMPDVVATWIENANRKLAEVDAQIVELEGMVDTATDAATRAEQSASTASTKAEQAAGSAATATEKATEATNAAGTATAKAAEAEQSALTATEKATAAAESERIATAKAGDAITAASTATAKAGQATEAAQTATEKAGDASASATAAHASEINAAESADDALSAEVGANAAKRAAEASATQAGTSEQNAGTAAQTATQKAAEATQSATDAETFAGTATTKAEEAAASAQAASDAQAAVEEFAEQLADSLEQIAQNTHDIAEHEQYAEATYATKTDLYKKADIIHSTASGAIASFPDGADGHPVDSLKVAIEPVQDLHGYENPWPAGGAKNKMPNAIPKTETINGVTFTLDQFGVFTVKGTATSDAVCKFPIGYSFTILDGDPKPKFALNNTQSTSALFQLFNGNVQIDSWGINPVNRTQEYSAMRGKTCNEYRISVPKDATVDFTMSPMIVENSESDYSYIPYSNICPITGWDGVKVSRTGKNLFDETAEASLIDVFGIDGNRIKRIGYEIHLPTGTYTWSAASREGLGAFLYLNIVNADGSLNEFWYFVASKTVKNKTFTITDGQYVVLYDAQVDQEGAQTKFSNFNIQLELGSTASDYEPYAGNTYDITLPTEAGTVYGGELTVNADGSGSLAVDRAIVDLGTLVHYKSSAVSSVNGSVFSIPLANIGNGVKPRQRYTPNMVLSEAFMTCNADVWWVNQMPDNSINVGTDVMFIACSKYDNTADFKAAVTGQQLVYELAEPITYSLTASEIRTLLGQNNVWSDAGDVSVKYNADTKLYIDNKITQAIAAALNA